MNTNLIAALLACCMSAALAEDHPRPRGTDARTAVSVDATVIAENEFVQVVRMAVPGNFTTPMHDISPRAVVWLSDARYVDHFENGTAKEESRRAGDAEWVSARRHAGQNLSEKPMEFIAVIVKAAAAGGHDP